MVKVRCPGCQATVEVDPKAGPVVECDECGKKFRLAVKKPAAAAAGAATATKRKPTAPADDDDDEDDEPVQKKPKKKKRSKSSGPPIWLMPVVGVAVIAAIALTIIFVVVPTMKRGLLFDAMAAITDDMDSIAVIRPKAVGGASGISAMVETMKGGGAHYAPTPPEGYGYERGHVTEALAVKKGLKQFHIIRFEWTAKPTTPPVETHRGVPIRKDQPKHLEKPRFVVTGGRDMCLFDSLEDAKAGVDRMLDSKKPGYFPQPKAAAFFTRTPGNMQEVFLDHSRDMLTASKIPEIDKPKTVYVELSFKDNDYAVTYTCDYGTPEAAEKAKKSIVECRKAVKKEIEEWWKKHPDQDGNPFFNVEGLMNKELENEGGKLSMRVPFSTAHVGPGKPLIREAFQMGDAPFGGITDPLDDMKK
jgi:hypothetical protein